MLVDAIQEMENRGTKSGEGEAEKNARGEGRNLRRRRITEEQVIPCFEIVVTLTR